VIAGVGVLSCSSPSIWVPPCGLLLVAVRLVLPSCVVKVLVGRGIHCVVGVPGDCSDWTMSWSNVYGGHMFVVLVVVVGSVMSC